MINDYKSRTQPTLFRYLCLSLLLVSVTGENFWSENIPLSNNTLDLIISYIIFFFLIKNIRFGKDSIDKKSKELFFLYFLWFGFTCFRGLFMAVDYFSYRNLVYSVPITFFPLFIYSFADPLRFAYFIKKWMHVCLPLFIFLAFVLDVDAYGFYLMPITLLTPFLFSLKNKWVIFLVIISLFVVFADVSARSSVVKFLLPICLSIGFLFRRLIGSKILILVSIFFVVAPYLFISLAAFADFNILRDSGKSISVSAVHKGEKADTDLFDDTRTFIYVDVITSAVENNYVLWGRTPARGNDTTTNLFEKFNIEHNRPVSERFANEIGAANAFTHFGIIGLIIFLLLYYRAIYLALYKSNSYYMKLIGVSISFRSLYFFIEDYYTLRIQTIALVLLIAMAYSVEFRKMSNKDYKIWINQIMK